MAEVLLDHGADVNAAKADGDTPLHLSLKRELMFKSSLVNPYYNAVNLGQKVLNAKMLKNNNCYSYN